MFRVQSILALLGLALPLGLSAATLEYRLSPGDSFRYVTRTVVNPPRYDPIVSRTVANLRVSGSGPYTLSGTLSGSSNQFPVQNSRLSFDLTEGGQTSNLQSPNLNHPVDGALIKNTPGLFFPLPAGNFAPGQSFQGQTVVYLPQTDLPGSFPQLRTVTRMTMVGTKQDSQGNPYHEVSLTIKEAPGARQKADLRGVARFDPAKGRWTYTKVTGTLKVRVAFIWVSIPFEMELTEAGLAL